METSSLTFAQPAWFLALLLVPAFAGLYYWSQRRSDALISKIVAPRLKAQLAGAVSVARRAFKAALILCALVLVVIALARPQMGYVEHEVKQRGRDVIFAVDTSRSMLATDVNPTRLARAKLMAQDLMRLVQGDRIGLIAFAGSAFLQAPLTIDYNAVLNSLDELDTTVIPKGGTNIAAAIRAAEEAFGKGEGQTKALIILTDGEELDADGIAAAKSAAQHGVRIFTVGIGSGEGSLIPIRAEGGGTDFVRDASGKPVQSRLDESRLKEIAEASGGFYQALSPEAARQIFERGILPMEQNEESVMTSRQPIERYEWPLGAAVALVVVWLLVGDRRRTPRLTRAAAAAAAALMLVALPTARADSGLDEYQSGNYGKAFEDFSQRLKSSPDSDKLNYNTGAAAYKMGDFGKAVDHFTKALLSDDTKLREEASYNLGNSLVRRGESAKGSDEKKADWKNAIQHYTEALNIDPKNKQAEENRDIVKKLLEDLEKQEQQQKDQQQKQDQQQKDDQKKDDQKQDQKNNQQQKNQDKKDQKDQQQDKKDQGQQGQDQQNKDQKDQDQKNDQNKDQQDKSGQGNQGDKNQNQDQKQNPEKDDQQKDQNKPDDKGEQKQDQNNQSAQNQNNQPKTDQQQQQAQGQPSPTPGQKKEGDLKTAGGDEKKDQQQAQAGQAGEGGEEKDGEMTAAQAKSLLNSLRGDEQRVNLMQRQESEETLKDW